MAAALLDSRPGLAYLSVVDASEKLPKEWFLQADYDMDTAQYMFDGGRYFYCIFMCHLSIEKALKGLYRARLKSDPPKVHDLLFLANRARLAAPAEVKDLLYELDGLSVPTRYPDELKKMALTYNQRSTEPMLARTREALQWLRAQLPK
jgi:HEPN domain-containing protein